ncbi:MAG: SufS family cysteine desulfurase [Armatimonadetes bacterium]|nr:SufS family cysteine desulfurase [Armatimonadota bacterium]
MTVAPLRNEFPALDQEVNGRRLAYLDNAATTQRPEAVIQAVEAFTRYDNANVHRGVHTVSQRATDKFDAARATVARAIGASRPEEIVFTKGCTEALNLVASSWGRANLSEGDVVLVSTMEHHSNLVPWQQAATLSGAKVVPIPVTDSGEIDLDDYVRLLASHPVKMVAVKHVCNAIGTVNPVGDMVSEAHRAGALVTVDGAQALAHVRVDVSSIGADFYAMASHKVYGPMGTGALYGRFDLLDRLPPYQTGGGTIRSVTMEETTFAELPDRLEAGTPNVPGAIGFAAALDWLERHDVESLARHESDLLRTATEAVTRIPGITVIGQAARKAGILSFTMEAAHPHDVGTVLDSEGVAVRTGHHCCQPLMRRFGVPATTRASLAAYNTEDDVEALVRGLDKVARLFA